MITDEAIITIKAGKGGNGHVSFRREKYVPKGGPDGGDGGDGGHIFIVCDDAVHTLTDYARKKDYKAQNGEEGRPKKQTGKGGEDLNLKVPPGTIVRENGEIVKDFTEIGESLRIAKGGKGGRGNVHFATAVRQAPRYAEPGTPGEEKTLHLELKLIADIGLIGLPNAGKSTLLSRISNARPKIADYPFTTLEPNLGVTTHRGSHIVVADIPGLIKGASEGKGLGDKFLKHIERTKILVHVLDITSDDILRDYKDIRLELEKWSKVLTKKEEIIAINKADTLESKEAQKIADKLSKTLKKQVYLISAVSGQGIDQLLDKIISTQ